MGKTSIFTIFFIAVALILPGISTSFLLLTLGLYELTLEAIKTINIPFLLPLVIGICYACNGNVLTDAFGLVALVALSPLLTIQILGIIYKLKSKKESIVHDIDESILEFNLVRGETNG